MPVLQKDLLKNNTPDEIITALLSYFLEKEENTATPKDLFNGDKRRSSSFSDRSRRDSRSGGSGYSKSSGGRGKPRFDSKSSGSRNRGRSF